MKVSPSLRLIVAPPVNVIVGAVVSPEVPSGQVPQRGLLASVSPEDEAKSDGSDVIFVTHHPVKSWLNTDAS